MPRPAPRTAHTATRPAMRRRGRSSYLALDPVLLPLPSQTPLYSTTISKALRTALRGRAVANFGELRKDEVRRIPLPRTRMNNGERKAGDSRGGPQHIMESDFA